MKREGEGSGCKKNYLLFGVNLDDRVCAISLVKRKKKKENNALSDSVSHRFVTKHVFFASCILPFSELRRSTLDGISTYTQWHCARSAHSNDTLRLHMFCCTPLRGIGLRVVPSALCLLSVVTPYLACWSRKHARRG